MVRAANAMRGVEKVSIVVVSVKVKIEQGQIVRFPSMRQSHVSDPALLRPSNPSFISIPPSSNAIDRLSEEGRRHHVRTPM